MRAISAPLRPETKQLFLLLGSGLFLFVLLLNAHAELFLEPYREYADLAANALRIESAREFDQIYGHYSRWGFDHPGPGMFYLYAFGEELFFHRTGIVPSPYNAHLLTGFLFQFTLFLTALYLIARELNLVLFLPIATSMLALHLGSAEVVFLSIWAPHALLMPFLCFIVSIVTLSTGRGAVLPLATFLAAFLVHTHVAQPLFVIPIYVCGYILLLCHTTSKKGLFFFFRAASAFPKSHIFAALILGLFLLPLAIDLLRGTDSNLYSMVQHLSGTGGDRKSLSQSINYLFSFIIYERDPSFYFFGTEPDSYTYLTDQLWKLILWLTVYIGPLVYWHFYRKRVTANPSVVTLIYSLYAFTTIGILLALVWGIAQSGTMFRFNGYFYYGLTAIPLLIAASTIASIFNSYVSNTVAMICYGLSTLIFVSIMGSLSRPDARWIWKAGGVQDVLSQDKMTDVKYLAFEHGQWRLAIAMALELQRNGYDFRIQPQWGFMFGTAKVLTAANSRDGEISIWRVLPQDRLPTEGITVTHEDGVFLPGTYPHPLDPSQGEIVFGVGGNSILYEGLGWGGSDDKSVWSASDVASLLFRPLPTKGDICMRIQGRPYLGNGSRDAQRVNIFYGQLFLTDLTWRFTESKLVTIPRQLWNGDERGEILFEFLDAVSPRSIGLSEDRRKLAVLFDYISFRACE